MSHNNNDNSVDNAGTGPKEPSTLVLVTLGNDFHVPTAKLFRTLDINLECIEIFSKDSTNIDELFQKYNFDIESVGVVLVAIASNSLDLESIFHKESVFASNDNYATIALLPDEITADSLPKAFRKLFTCHSISKGSVENIRQQIKSKLKDRKRIKQPWKALLVYKDDNDGTKALGELVSELGAVAGMLDLGRLKCDSEPVDAGRFQEDVQDYFDIYNHVIVLLTKDSWNSKRWAFAVEQALKAKKNIVTIHDTASVPVFPNQLPEGVKPIMEFIAIKFIHQRSKSCWNKVIKRMKPRGVENIETDVFLSHKQATGQGIALALFNELTTKHKLNPFLDVKVKFSLHDLERIVAQTKLFVFILTPGIFDSYWCGIELQSAIQNKKKVVFVCDAAYDPTADVAKANPQWQRLFKYMEFPAKRDSNTLLYDANYIGDCAKDIANIVRGVTHGPTPYLYKPEGLFKAACSKVHVIGGWTHGKPTNAVKTFLGGQWNDGVSMTTPRFLHSAQVYQGKIFVAGGKTGEANSTETNSTEIFGRKWNVGANMIKPRQGFGLHVVGDQLYAIGGATTNTIEMYHPENNTWNLTQSALPVSTLGFFGSAVWENTVIIGGGKDGSEYNSCMWQFDPRQPSISEIGKYEGFGLQFVTLGDFIYCLGGKLQHPAPWNVKKFDIRNGKWLDIAPMKFSRFNHAAVVFENKIIVLGGQVEEKTAVSSVDEYNPQSNSWSQLGNVAMDYLSPAAVVYM